MGFTHSVYDQLLGAVVQAGYRVLTLRQSLDGSAENLVCIIRHDVEWNLKRTLAITEIEKQHRVRSSLYFRVDTKVFDPPTMRRLQDEGFEIGYHYNTLDRCHGDFARAIALFEQEVELLRREGLNVTTAIPHGDPRIKKTGYRSNGDVCERDPHLLERTGLSDIAAGLETHFPSYKYLRDLGIRWNTGDRNRQLIARIREKQWPVIYLLTHPDYWSRSVFRAAGLQVLAHALRGFRINEKIAGLRASLTARRH